MAANTFKPNDAPRRANVPREVAPPVPVPVVAPEPVAVVEEVRRPEPAPRPARAPRPERAPAPEREEPAGPRSTWSIFSLLDRMTSVDGLFREGLPVRYLPNLLFIMLLTLLYIGNTHYGNRMNRNIQRLKQETEDLRADYTTLKSDYMEGSKQSEVARKVAAFGLVESSSPPFRIQVPTGRLDAAELELMPVLTADTLAARAARDSSATHLADSLAGRRRVSPLATEDSGPEIVAPLEDSDGEPDPATATSHAAKRSTTKSSTQAAAKAKAKKTTTSKNKKNGTNKPDRKNTVQKSTSKPKKQAAHSQATKAKTR